MIQGFIHFGISVGNLESTLSFLCDGLGFEVRKRFERPQDYTEKVTGVSDTTIQAALISGYGVTLELLEYNARSDRPLKGVPIHYPGAAHICLEVDEIEVMISELSSKGAEFQEAITIVPFDLGKGNKVIYGRGPDGITFEFVEKRKEKQ